MAAAAASGGAGSAWPASSSTTTSSRFAAACGALSQYVRAAEAERAHVRPAVPGPVRRPLQLMPGADVDACPDDCQGADKAGPAPAQMTIVYGGRVMVLDSVPAEKAAGLLRLAAAAAREGAAGEETRPAADLPVARKASLQRFMEKRKGRAAARAAPYRRPDGGDADACPVDDQLKLAL